jgi:hypothetical protein
MFSRRLDSGLEETLTRGDPDCLTMCRLNLESYNHIKSLVGNHGKVQVCLAASSDYAYKLLFRLSPNMKLE